MPLLRSKGHEVYAPSLTGLGDRSHLLSHSVDLETHIRDIVNLMEFEDLTNVILVGHSYGGIVIAGVAELVPGRINHMVYLDAVTPRNGQSCADFISINLMAKFRKLADEEGDGWRFLCPSDWTFGITEPDLSWVRKRLTPQPMATLEQKVHFSNQEALALPKSFIWCSVSDGKRQKSRREEFSSDWGFYEIETEHDAMITAPKELTRILLELVPKA